MAHPLPHPYHLRLQFVDKSLVSLLLMLQLSGGGESAIRTQSSALANPGKALAARPHFVKSLDRDRDDRHLQVHRQNRRAFLERLRRAINRAFALGIQVSASAPGAARTRLRAWPESNWRQDRPRRHAANAASHRMKPGRQKYRWFPRQRTPHDSCAAGPLASNQRVNITLMIG